jgi:hypothetical protein
MSAIVLADLATLAFVGILAGMEIAIHYGIREPAQSLNEHCQLQLRQALVLRLRILVPAFFLPAVVSGIADVVLNSTTGAGYLFRCLGMVCVFAWIATRVIGTVRINQISLTWDIAAPPKNWRALIDRAERFHVVGAWAALAALASFLAALGLKLTAL